MKCKGSKLNWLPKSKSEKNVLINQGKVYTWKIQKISFARNRKKKSTCEKLLHSIMVISFGHFSLCQKLFIIIRNYREIFITMQFFCVHHMQRKRLLFFCNNASTWSTFTVVNHNFNPCTFLSDTMPEKMNANDRAKL